MLTTLVEPIAAEASAGTFLATTGIGVVYWIFNSVMQFVLSYIFSLVITLLEWFSAFLLQPFSFVPDMFLAVFGKDVTEGIEEIAISAGLGISVLLLAFGLIRVFSGKFVDDVPNPFALVGRFLIAVVCNYWIIAIIYDYVFPFAQKFFNKALGIASTSTLATANLTNAVNNLMGLGNNGEFEDAAIIVDEAMTGLSTTLGTLIILTIFLIGIIAFIINVFKLIVENAERYFTVNLLTIAAPLATSTIVSEKSSGIFKAWWQMMLSNILTIIFNIIGFRMLVFAFNNCITVWLQSTFDLPVALTSIVALVAASKMIQKFDQLLALLTFKINPIHNKSLIMGVLAGIGGLQKGFGAIGKIATGIKNAPQTAQKFFESPLNPVKPIEAVVNGAKKTFDKVAGNNTVDETQNTNQNTPQNQPKLNNIPYDFAEHFDKLKPSDSQQKIKLDPTKFNDVDFKTKEGFDALKNAVEDNDNALYGIRRSKDGEYSVTLGPRGGEGGFAPDTLRDALNGCEYYFTANSNENPLDSLPEGKYIAGAEVINYSYDDPTMPATIRYYMTEDANFASPHYHSRGTVLNGEPVDTEEK